MISVKDAVSKALQGFNQFFPDQELQGLELEEVEMSEDEQYWLITLGFDVPNLNPPTGIGAIMQTNQQIYKRKYKVFEIEATSGKVKSMKIRQI